MFANKPNSRKKKKVVYSDCKMCGKPFRGKDKFCGYDCEDKWEKRKEHELICALLRRTCVYPGCRSGLPIVLGGLYCSQFCLAEQSRINKKRNEEIAKRTKKILKEVDKMTFEPAPVEIETPTQRQERIDAMKNEVIKKRIDNAIKEVTALTYDTPVYVGPMEQARDLFGV